MVLYSGHARAYDRLTSLLYRINISASQLKNSFHQPPCSGRQWTNEPVKDATQEDDPLR
jgi:hypothetical protein